MSDQAIEVAPPQPTPQALPWKPKHNPWIIALTVTLATFMEVLDTSIANVALPHIAGDLSAGVDREPHDVGGRAIATQQNPHRRDRAERHDTVH